MKKILVLCTGNSCRSQMAHGYLTYFGKENVEVYSAGVEVHGVNPIAIGVMNEDEVDITKHTSNHIDDYMNIKLDLVFTVCDNAKESCPYFPTTAKMIHHSFNDPAGATGTVKEILTSFRNTRDEIRTFCDELINSTKYL
jgi:arsenate reductase